MSRGWKIAIGVLVALAVLLALNTVALDNETKAPEVTIEGGEIVELPGGRIQVLDEEPAAGGGKGRRGASTPAPIVLIHGYSASLHWWDRMAPELTDAGHRVVRVDLLGHGGSDKPSSGYEITSQASLVAGALNQLGVEGAVVVGHSMGGSVATALAERSSELVDRVVTIDTAPAPGYGGLNLMAQAQYVPVLGEAMWRFAHVGPWQDPLVESGYKQAFAPGYEIESGFPNPDQVVEDYDAMTYTSFDQAHAGSDEFQDERSLADRLTAAAVPVLAIFGSEDQLYDDPAETLAGYEEVPGATTAEIEGAGHSPNVERPRETAALIREFAANASDAEIGPPPEPGGTKSGRKGGRGRADDGGKPGGGRDGRGKGGGRQGQKRS
jgi:pimeloyl-ACP methyl ester carboxylesterase